MDSKVVEAILRLDQGEEAALATIVATKGSTPRKSGAQVLFYRDGRTAGTIGGGCGESEVRQHAFQALNTKKSALVQVNLTHDVAEEDGMVCGGIMEVFVEPVQGKYEQNKQ